MNNPFEKTNALVTALDFNNMGGNLKVRLGRAAENPDFLFFSQNRATLESIANGVKLNLNRRPTIYSETIGDNFSFKLGTVEVKELCLNLKLNFSGIKQELIQNNAYVDNMNITPESLSATQKGLGKK